MQDLIGRTELIFAPETLEYLQKGGRIGRASALVTSTHPTPGQALIDVVPLGALLVVAAAVLLRRKGDPWPHAPALIAAAWAFVPPLLLLAAGIATGDPMWVSRYWVLRIRLKHQTPPSACTSFQPSAPRPENCLVIACGFLLGRTHLYSHL